MMTATLDLTTARIKQLEFTPLEATPSGLSPVLTLRRLLAVECLAANEHGLGIMVATRDTKEALGWPAHSAGTLAVFLDEDGKERRHEIGRVTLKACIPVQRTGQGSATARLIFAIPFV